MIKHWLIGCLFAQEVNTCKMEMLFFCHLFHRCRRINMSSRPYRGAAHTGAQFQLHLPGRTGRSLLPELKCGLLRHGRLSPAAQPEPRQCVVWFPHHTQRQHLNRRVRSHTQLSGPNQPWPSGARRHRSPDHRQQDGDVHTTRDGREVVQRGAGVGNGRGDGTAATDRGGRSGRWNFAAGNSERHVGRFWAGGYAV